MIVGFLVSLGVTRYLKKNLQTKEKLPYWDQVFSVIFVVSIIGVIVSAAVKGSSIYLMWLSDAIMLYLAYVLFTRKEFLSARSYLNALLPFVILSVIENIVGKCFPSFYDTWSTYFNVAEVFAVIWLVVMLIINRKQQKAIAAEKLKNEAREKELKISENLKAELEIQVAERTAELTKQKDNLETALAELKAAQSQLVQAEKMASLGELTAGIAHEIQNPLNFVNNFSEVSAELIEELMTEKGKLTSERNDQLEKDLLNDIQQNLEKIVHHGKRADSIVKGMLQHSRKNDGIQEPTDINGLCDEYLRLSYHGLRAKDKSFNATLKTDFDTTIQQANVVPQDFSRVIMNLVTNAFYAVHQKQKLVAAQKELTSFEKLPSLAKASYQPTVAISTKHINNNIEIKVTDNGNGIPRDIIDKIFQPFFTTKPTGEGTGLGLSLSYDIVKAHGGELTVKSKENEGTDFTIRLPL